MNMAIERKVLESIQHPFIVNLRYAFQTETKLYLVMDYIAGGELFQRLDTIPSHQLNYNDCKFYAAQLVLAIEHLHSQSIIYRDLKPENVLLDTAGNIVLTDFGFAKPEVNAVDAGSLSFVGCLHEDQEILTYNGDTIRIGDLTEGHYNNKDNWKPLMDEYGYRT